MAGSIIQLPQEQQRLSLKAHLWYNDLFMGRLAIIK